MLGQLVNAIVLGSIYLLFSVGLSLSWGVLKILNLAHGSIFMFGAFSAYLVTTSLGIQLPLPVLLAVAAAVGALISVALYLLVFRPILRRATDNHSGELSILIASIGIGLIPVTIAINLSPAEVVNLPESVTDTVVHRIGDVVISDLQILIVALAVVITIALALWINRTQGGRALRAIAVAPDTASLLGVRVGMLSAGTMALSGALAGTAGLLLAANANAVQAHMGDSLLLKAFAVIVLGGVGSIAGAAIGAYALAIAETAAVVFISGGVRDAIAFTLILVMLLIRPRGLFGERNWSRA